MEGTPVQGMEQHGKIMHDWKEDLERWVGLEEVPGTSTGHYPHGASMESWRGA